MYHRLTPRDQATDLLRIVTQRRVVTGNAVTLQSFYDVPLERLFLLNSLTVEGIGGGAATFVQWQLLIQEPPGFANVAFQHNHRVRDEAGLPLSVNGYIFNGSPMLMVNPGHRLGISADFSSGVPLNELRVSLNGILIPHGTFSE